MLLFRRRVVSDASMAAVATAACLHLAGGDKDFRVTAPSLSFPDTWGADLVMQVCLISRNRHAWGRYAGCDLVVTHQSKGARPLLS